MRGIFCSTKAQNNAQFAEELKRKDRFYILLLVLGLLTGAAGFGGYYLLKLPLKEELLGFYAGAGTGLCLAAVVFLWRSASLRRSEEKMTQARLELGDERLQLIADKALRAASIVLMTAVYLGGLVGGLYDLRIMRACLLLSGLFLLSFFAARRYYGAKL